MTKDPIVIVGMARTPMGSFQGSLSSMSGPKLGSVAIKSALERAQVLNENVSEVIMGCVLPAGQGQAPARQAALGAGIPMDVGATTINKMCGSGMKATMFGHDLIVAGSANIAVVGGLESMSNAPYLLPKVRQGLRMGHAEVKDHMFIDGLEDAYDKGQLMGVFAENTAEKYQFTRESQDEFAIRSLKRGKKANEDGSFDAEMAPVTIKTRKEEVLVDRDEQPFSANLEKIPTLKPAFRKDGTVTAANSSSISDGASALVLMRRSEAEKRGITPLATIVAHATHSQAPEWFTTAPVGAISRLFERTGWSKDEVGLFEINEAFAVVTMAAMREHGLSVEQVNVHGGACAMGHPVGSSGSRIICTLVGAMHKYDVSKGVAALCIGGGEATAVAIERVN
ncbi:MAG: acetyl-CoA C-acyltransferase [Alphaproteobacteria bacterium]|jgi:acetyl-CoA C-acetyltransferase|nr:MAG: Acetyl-CoA acetyltransferase [Alphaproteobacteria bacterium MarineAlpha9_Bin6]HIN93527.1 acetyl-CoA C-acyltransferase [Alphaproteobacteria bacterium]